MKQEKYLTVIPARGGSKRIPHKNLRPILNKPLIAWTIEAALNCKKLQHIIVNTDSKDIISVAQEMKVKVPFIRSPELSSDTATTVDVLVNTIDFYALKKIFFEYLVLLQPTSPLRNENHIFEALEILEEKNADAIISVTPCRTSPHWCNTLSKSLSMDNFLDRKYLNIRSQDLPQYYQLNGAIFICKVERFLEEKTFLLKKNAFAYIMNEYNSIDIDSEFDLFMAEKILELKYLD